ncbi:MAG: hypothetical protein IRZ07_10700, partial [Microbispora sp.]|nr:hypothetical protein [Microbispora sp.]
MALFELDPKHPRHLNDGDGEWWDRLIAGSPLWSGQGPLARDDRRDLFSTSSEATDNPIPRMGSGRTGPALTESAFGAALFTGGTRSGGTAETGVAEGFGRTRP